ILVSIFLYFYIQMVRKQIAEYDAEGNLKRIWNSSTDAEAELKVDKKGITSCCNTNRNGANVAYKGIIFKYYDPDGTQALVTDFIDYIPIGAIKDCNMARYFIKNDGSKIVNVYTGRSISYSPTGRDHYFTVDLYCTDNERHKLSVHKIINQVLKGGDYTDEIAHLDNNKQNNALGNLVRIARSEVISSAIGKPVKKIDFETGKEENFSSVSAALESIGRKRATSIRNVCNGKKQTAF